MRISFKSIFLSLLATSFCTAAVAGGYFQQGFTVDNRSGQDIFVTDPAKPSITNRLVQKGYLYEVAFASDESTSSMQKFSHTVNIVSAVDYSPICTVTSHIEAQNDDLYIYHPLNSNKSRCVESTYDETVTDSTGSSMIYGFEVDVVR